MAQSKKEKKKKSWKRELAEWGVFLAIIGGLYLSGYHTEVIGRLQSVLLFTGLMQPDTQELAGNPDDAYFNMPLVSLDGESGSLADFKGNTIFMNFWATWCPPCIAEMPNIQDLYDDVAADSSIRFVMISLDEDPQQAKDFMERKGFTMPVFFLSGRTPGVYNSTVVPTTYVISPEGKIVLEHRGMAKYNTEKFKNFLQQLSQSNYTAEPIEL